MTITAKIQTPFDVLNALADNNGSTEQVNIEHFINGFKTCSLLVSALALSENDDISAELTYLLNMTKDLSGQVLESLKIPVGDAQDAARAVVLHAIQECTANSRDDLLEPSFFVPMCCSIIRQPGVSIERTDDVLSGVIMHQAKLAFSLALLYTRTGSYDDLSERIRTQVTRVIKEIERAATKLMTFHVSSEDKALLIQSLIAGSIPICISLHKREMRIVEARQQGGKGTDVDVDDLVIRSFKVVINSIMDALMVSGEMKK